MDFAILVFVSLAALTLPTTINWFCRARLARRVVDAERRGRSRRQRAPCAAPTIRRAAARLLSCLNAGVAGAERPNDKNRHFISTPRLDLGVYIFSGEW
jgi:hypothetical protein